MTTELEIEIFKDDTYAVQLRLSSPEAIVLQPSARGVAAFDVEALTSAPDPDAYGRLLATQLFHDPAVLDAYCAARRDYVDAGKPLRLRLTIDRSALELHRVWWETLREPDRPGWVLANDRVYFSRFLHTQNGRAATLRARDVLRSVAFIANPDDLRSGTRTDGRRKLESISIAAEEVRARATLLPPLALIKSDPADPGRASLDNLLAAIRDGCDVCYLACHGAGGDARASARVFFEDGDAKDAQGHRVSRMKMVTVDELAVRLASLAHLPTVIVLASCESAGAIGDGDGLASLGPRLIDAGVLAVVAMQGRITVETAGMFTQAMFAELAEHGEIDRAMAIARNTVYSRPDAWMPVLFSRLRQGMIWYTPGFTGANNVPWESIVSSTRNEEEPLVPVLGPGLVEHMIGSAESYANEFASDAWRAVPPDWDDLPRLAQYRAATHGRGLVVNEILALIQRRAEQSIQRSPQPGDRLHRVLEEVWRHHRDTATLEPHWFLSSLNVPIFITTNIDDSLAHALRARGRRPQVEIFRWNDAMDCNRNGERNLSMFKTQPGAPARVPTVDEPLVFHLFGHIRDRRSLVITEDDFFDYLMWARTTDGVPTVVSTALRLHPLLFLGFRLEDWRFRVMFRSILAAENRPRDPEWVSVAAQVVPEEGGVLPMRAYLEEYLSHAQIKAYWGRVQDFVRDLAAAIARGTE